MSQAILTLLREHTAFKPKPPEYELAIAHVPLGQVGLENPIDDRVLEAMCSVDESFTIVLAPPGCGKTSALSAAAMHAAQRESQPRVLPLRVPVGHHTTALDALLLVRAVASELANQLAPLLDKRPRERLERALATTITRSRQGTRISLALNAVTPHSPIGASLGVQLAGDLTTLTSQGGWQGGPHAGLLALRDIADARNARLVIIFDDTDTWSEGDEDMAPRARDFFVALQALIDCPEVTMFVAVQDHWGTAGTRLGRHTDAARARYRELERRAGRRLAVPLPKTRSQARGLMTAIIERRIAITLPEQQISDPGWCAHLFTDGFMEGLAERCLRRGVRQALCDLRDVLDHTEILPAKLDQQDLIDAMSR